MYEIFSKKKKKITTLNRLEIIKFKREKSLSASRRIWLTHRRSESWVEGFVVEIEVSAGLDHVAHDATEA